jgi:hypothetical protein
LCISVTKDSDNYSDLFSDLDDFGSGEELEQERLEAEIDSEPDNNEPVSTIY